MTEQRQTETIWVSTAVQITVQSETDAIERITGPHGDEWRAQMYPLHTRNDVLNHLAINAATSGVTDISELDGWADVSPGEITAQIVGSEVER